MTIEIVRGINDKPDSTNKLVKILSEQRAWEGRLYVGYPIAGTSRSYQALDAMWISKSKGVVAFDLVDRADAQACENVKRQDVAANNIEIRLRKNPTLVENRKLSVPIHTITFASFESESGTLQNETSLVTTLAALESWNPVSKALYENLKSTCADIFRLRGAKVTRNPVKPRSRGMKLKNLEEAIATLDYTQSKAVLETPSGIQRIRGLTGSGKTTVLALKAAYLHLQQPDWNLAVTFYAHALKPIYQQLIQNFYYEMTNDEPNWEKIKIGEAYGVTSDNRNDELYYEFCRENNVEYQDINTAREEFGRADAFKMVCERALYDVQNPKQEYHAILVDEAQDLPTEYLNICFKFLHSPKRLVCAYDELQNLVFEPLPAPEQIFNDPIVRPRESPAIDLATHEPERDVVFNTCYRNSRPILVTAHALRLGIYREAQGVNPIGESELNQAFEDPLFWQAIGYRLYGGKFGEGSEVSLGRTNETSPKHFESHSHIDDIVKFVVLKDQDDQANWLMRSIKQNLTEDELQCKDIIVIDPDPSSYSVKVGPIRALLLENGVNSFLSYDSLLRNARSKPSDSVRFTRVNSFWREDAPMVYVINADRCQASRIDLAFLRHRLATAITSSNAWVRVVGLGPKMEALKLEFERLRESKFLLKFRHPTEQERTNAGNSSSRGKLREKQWVDSTNWNLINIVRDLQSEKIDIGDLDQTTLKQFERALRRNRSE